MLNVLVTGGAGYIGSHTAKVLAQSGFSPIILDNLSTGNRWAAEGYQFFEVDLANEERTVEILSAYKVAAIIHFAASAYVGESVTHPQKYFENNVANGLKLLSAARRAHVNAIIFSSSCATYGNPLTRVIAEDHLQHPINAYGESKLTLERALHWYGQAYGIRSVSLRYFNAAGADPDGTLGECHNPETHLIPAAIEAAMGKRQFLDVFGTDFPTCDGTAVRDFIHVTDLASAHLLALKYILDGGNSEAVNLGTGKGASVQQVLRFIEKAARGPVPVRYAARRPGDPPSLIANNTKAARLLDWRPVHSDIDYVIETAWRWHSGGGLQHIPVSAVRPSVARAAAT